MKKQTSWLIIAATTAFLLQGCAQASKPNAQAPAQQPPAAAQQPPAVAQQPSPATPQPTQPGQAAGQPASNQGAIDLTPELKVNPSMIIGTTTYNDTVAKFGKPLMEKDHKTAFRTELTKKGSKLPQIVDTYALFHVNPVTGEKMDKVFPYFFTKDAKKVLVASQILPHRGTLLEKIKNSTATFDDVKKYYGTPIRETSKGLEYYDFDHKISLHVTNVKKRIVFFLTKYDLLYGSNTTDLQAHEDTIKRLAKEKK